MVLWRAQSGVKKPHSRESFDWVTIYYLLKIFQDLRTHTYLLYLIFIFESIKNAWHYNQLLTL